jgi:hypothetical protein
LLDCLSRLECFLNRINKVNNSSQNFKSESLKPGFEQASNEEKQDSKSLALQAMNVINKQKSNSVSYDFSHYYQEEPNKNSLKFLA